jgi:hypothetical protein
MIMIRDGLRWDLTFVLLENTLPEWISGVTRYARAGWQMIDNLTDGILATSSGTRIFAFAVDASKVGRTIRVQDTFGSAAFIRVSDIIAHASASTSSVLLFAYCIGTARTGRARSSDFHWIVLANFRAVTEWIAGVATDAIAHRSVTDNTAFSVLTTSVGARVLALLVDASQVTRAFRVADAFRLAVRRISDHLRETRARSLITNDSANRVRTTRRGLTRVSWRRLLDHLNLASYERIASVSRRTAADRIVVDDLTFGIDAASSRTWIAALLVATSLVLGTFIAGHTLGPTGRRRSNVSRDARANCLAVDLAALRVWTTRRGLTWVLRLDWGWTKENSGSKRERHGLRTKYALW